MDLYEIKDRISLRLVNAQRCRYRLEEIPHTDFLDLTFIFYVVVSINSSGVDTMLITNKELELWGITRDELYDIAAENFIPLFSIQLLGTDPYERFVMITTAYKMFGAVFMSDTRLLSSFCDVFDDDVCIIPSSVHELILIPAQGIEPAQLNRVICDVNSQCVTEDEFLSDHMYLFSRKLGRVVF